MHIKMSLMSQMKKLPTSINGTHSLLYVPQLLLGLHRSTFIQTPFNWTGLHISYEVSVDGLGYANSSLMDSVSDSLL